MSVSANCVAMVEALEGCLKPVPRRPGYFTSYRCPADVPTIGIGHTNHHPPKFAEGDVWPRQQCVDVLAADLALFVRRVDRIMAGVSLAPHERDALISFDFNTGGLDRSSIPAKIRSGRRTEVRATLALWNKGGGRVLRGLVRRREAEADMFEGRVDEALRTAGAVRAEALPMPQQVDRPRPPPAEVARRARGELATATAGGATAAGGQAGTVQQDKPAPASSPAIGAAATVLGVAVTLAAIVLLVRKYRLIDADWA
jgi:lysozyme